MEVSINQKILLVVRNLARHADIQVLDNSYVLQNNLNGNVRLTFAVDAKTQEETDRAKQRLNLMGRFIGQQLELPIQSGIFASADKKAQTFRGLAITVPVEYVDRILQLQDDQPNKLRSAWREAERSGTNTFPAKPAGIQPT